VTKLAQRQQGSQLAETGEIDEIIDAAKRLRLLLGAA
jgi:hypothetical protein